MTLASLLSQSSSQLRSDNPIDLLIGLGRWIWFHLVAPSWVTPDAIFPDWSWTLPLGFLLIIGFMAWRKQQGVGLAYRHYRVFNFAHGAFWLPLALWFLGLSLIFWTPFLSFPPSPTWRPSWMLCVTGRQAFLMMSLGALVIPWAIVSLCLRLIRESVQPGIHGEAAWASRGEINISKSWPWFIPIKVHRRGIRRPWVNGGGLTILAPSKEVSRRHVLLRGGTGSGKGVFILGHILATARHATIYQDLKAECPHQDHLRNATGMEPIRWGAAADGGWPSMQWNPMEECRHDPNPQDAYETLAAVLIQGDDHDWVPQLTRPILAWVLASGHYRTLAELADDFTGRGVEAVLNEISLPSGLLQSLEGKNVKEYIGTAIFTHLAPFRNGWGREVTSGHDFSLSDIIERGGYILSAETVASRRAPLIVFWRLLFRRMLRTADPMDLTLLMDEGLAAGKIPDFADALNTLRSKGVSIVFAIQNTAGLKDIYGPQGGPAVENAFTNRITLLNGLNTEDAEKLSKRLGAYTRFRKQGQGASTQDRADLMTLEEVARRGAGEEDRWAVFEIVGTTSSKRPIMARLVPSELVIRKPVPAEIAALEKPVLGPPHGNRSGEADPQQLPTPETSQIPLADESGGF